MLKASPFQLLTLLLSFAFLGCGDSSVLTVSVVTDFALGDEARTMRVELETGVDSLRRRSLTLSPSDGMPSVFFEELADGTVRADVALLDPDGDVLATRPVVIVVAGATEATIVIARSCLEVACGDDMACHGGACVDPACTVDDTSLCGAAQCTAGAECTAEAACATSDCAGGVCLAVGDSSMCDAAEFCDPVSGCTGSMLPDCPVQLPAFVDADLTLSAGCTVQVPEDSHIIDGATLTVEGGARLEFGSAVRLFVGDDITGAPCGESDDCTGGLVVAGTAEQLAVFTSGSSSPTAGDWGGIVAGDQPIGVITIDGALIEYAGQSTRNNMGAVFITEIERRAPGRVAIRNSTFQHNSYGAIEAASGNTAAVHGLFESFANNQMRDNGDYSVRLTGNTMVELDAASIIEDPLFVAGVNSTSASGTWPAFDAPYDFVGDLAVNGGAMITLADGAVLGFRAGYGVELNAGTLAANDVTFGSASPMPIPGEWRGISADSTLALSNCRIENSGAAGDGAVVDIGRLAVVTITGTTFVGSVGDKNIDGFEPEDCAAFVGADPPNTFDLPVACE